MRTLWLKTRIHVLLGMIGASLLTGCGPGQGDLSGKVSHEGRPLASGSVLVRGSDGMVKGSPIKADGSYHVKAIAAGAVTITVTSPDPANVNVIARKQDAQLPEPKNNLMWFPIPEHYGDFDKSNLTYPLRPGSNRWDIELK